MSPHPTPDPQKDSDGADPAPARLAPGTRVDVRNRFDGHWASGFEVARALRRGYRLRRRSDNSILPTTFPLDDVRSERKRQSWWW
jgi:hypothetical protein